MIASELGQLADAIDDKAMQVKLLPGEFGQSESVRIFLGALLENAARDVRLVHFYMDALLRLQVPK